MKVSFKLSDADRERYGGDEWVHIDTGLLPGLGYDRLAELERDILRHDGCSLVRIIVREWPRTSMLGARGMVWLARQMCGFESPAWPDFKPDILGMDYRLDMADAGDAVPPTGGSSEPPSARTVKARNPRSKKG